MLELLWLVTYCGEVPVQVAGRIPGHLEWNRHVMYEAREKGYLDVYRAKYRQRVIRSLRITRKGIEFVAKQVPDQMALLLARQAETETVHGNLEKTMRANAVATGIVMALNAGAELRPGAKPSLLEHALGSGHTISPTEAYYYTSQELRDAMVELDPKSVAKTSRILGVLICGRQCLCLYYTGFSRMYWRAGEEMNIIAAIDMILMARGFRCDAYRQVVIGNNMSIPEKITKLGLNAKSKYLTVNDHFASCHFLTNDRAGDSLLRVIADEQLAGDFERRVMIPSFRPPAMPTRSYDAVTLDGSRPVSLNYQFDLKRLIQFDHAPEGFRQSPVILCLDYQTDAIQRIVGSTVEVRAIQKKLLI